jgi:hypothetical protein
MTFKSKKLVSVRDTADPQELVALRSYNQNALREGSFAGEKQTLPRPHRKSVAREETRSAYHETALFALTPTLRIMWIETVIFIGVRFVINLVTDMTERRVESNESMMMQVELSKREKAVEACSEVLARNLRRETDRNPQDNKRHSRDSKRLYPRHRSRGIALSQSIPLYSVCTLTSIDVSGSDKRLGKAA